MIFHNIDQNTEAWQKLRCTRFTSSVFSDLLMGKSTLGYNQAIYRVVYGRLTGEMPESFSNDWMSRGLELEPIASQLYESLTFDKCRPGGFWELDEWIGSSPDFLVGEDGLLQIKCPKWSTHVSALNGSGIQKEYFIQVQGEMLVTGRAWCDLLYYHPKLPHVINRICANEEEQENIKKEIRIAILKAKEILKKLGH